MNKEHKKNSGLRSQHGKRCSNCGQFILTPENSLGGRVKFLRAGTGKTGRGLARELPMAVSTLLRIESNKDLSMGSLKAIAEYFNVTLDYLAYGETMKDESS